MDKDKVIQTIKALIAIAESAQQSEQVAETTASAKALLAQLQATEPLVDNDLMERAEERDQRLLQGLYNRMAGRQD